MNYLLDLSLLDRPKALRVWMLYHKITSTCLAKALEVDPSLICRVLNCQKCSKRVLDKLVELGVPQSLLPVKKKGGSLLKKKSPRGRKPSKPPSGS
jgi:predicted transcriptional regulator